MKKLSQTRLFKIHKVSVFHALISITDFTRNDKIGICLIGAWYLDENGIGAWDAGTEKNYAFGTTEWIPGVGKWR